MRTRRYNPGQRSVCACGCGQVASYTGYASNRPKVIGCETSIKRWVESPADYVEKLRRARLHRIPAQW